MKECVIVCCYKRPELLFCCLKRVRETESKIPILLFPDRGTSKDALIQDIAKKFNAEVIHVGEHRFHGNSYNAGEALRLAYHLGYDLVHYVEEDAMPKPDLFHWTRQQHEDFENIFCSAGWIFNQHAPLDSGDYFVPWIYIPQFSIRREKLKLIVDCLGPLYHENMQEFLENRFKGSTLNKLDPSIWHYEIDGLIQRVLLEDRSQVVWPSVAKVAHVGFGGYNRGGYERYEDFFDIGMTFNERVDRVEKFINDPYARMEKFGRPIVERELGHIIPVRRFTYRIKLPGGWESTFVSELKRDSLGRRINSVTLPSDAEVVIIS